MKKSIVYILCCFATQICFAAPAYRSWCQKVQPDGSLLTVRLVGDEYYHYWETEDGMQAIESPDGTFVNTRMAVPSRDVFRARRADAIRRAHPAHQASAVVPNLASRGLVILVNFSNSQMDASHTHAVFDDMCNAVNCTTNVYNEKNYGSVAQYFADQSSGSYRPVFDVVGPVNLSHPVRYYGEDLETENDQSSNRYIADFVIDAVLAADAAGCDFSRYDSNNDGWVDYVYFLFAGKGQAAGGSAETIWPHEWDLRSALRSHRTHGNSGYYYNNNTNYNLPCLDGKQIGLYACSAELDAKGQLMGIGTMCHEFSHVLGLMDLYDTEYGINYEENLTPGQWDVMDQGNYNGEAHCPPNYNPWEKHFFGWVDPVNPGENGGYLSLYPSGSADYNTFQINDSTNVKRATESGLYYFLEYRQQRGWDEFLPTHGLLAWRVDYNEKAWSNDAPNASSTPNSPLLSVELVDYQWSKVSNKPVSDIYDLDSVLVFKYIDGGSDTPPVLQPLWTNWAYYDDGNYKTCLGYGGEPFYWGVMFPARTLAHDTLTKVAIYETQEYNAQPITIDIYSGGYVPMEENKIYTETVNPTGTTGFHEITLGTPLAFHKELNLWIVLSAGTDKYPATISRMASGDNGRWIANKGNDWRIITSEAYRDCSFMIRAYVQGTNPHQNNEQLNAETMPTKLLHDGQILILRGDKAYTVTGQEVR